jgi:hypothetical protein
MTRRVRIGSSVALLAVLASASAVALAQTPVPVVPKSQRAQISAERTGTHDAANIRTLFYNFGMVGDFPRDPQGVDLSVFHSVEVPKGTGMNYSDGITPFVLARIPLSTRAGHRLPDGDRLPRASGRKPLQRAHHAVRAAARLLRARPGQEPGPLDRDQQRSADLAVTLARQGE